MGGKTKADGVQNLEAWQAAQAAIRDIEAHPNQPPVGEADAPALPPKLDTQLASMPSDPVYPNQHADSASASTTQHEAHEGLPSPPAASPPADLESRMGMTSMQREIDRIEAANKPLPLPDAAELAVGSDDGGSHGPL